MNTHTIVADIRQNMLKARETIDGQDRGVSDTRSICIAEQTLTHVQTQNRSAMLITKGSGILYLCLACPENHHLHHQGFSLDATS